MTASAPAALPRFPYDHATIAQTDTSDPAAWRAANKSRFDSRFGAALDPQLPYPRGRVAPKTLAARIDAARQWRIDTRPYFDALYPT